MKMNKHKFIEELSKQTNLDINTCTIINSIFEDNFFISKSSKGKIIEELISTLNIDEDKANEIYDIAKTIMKEAIKYNLLHPFKDLDKE